MRWHRALGVLLILLSLSSLGLLALIKRDVDTRDAYLCLPLPQSNHDITHLPPPSSEPNQDMPQCPAHTSKPSWFLTGSFLVSVLVLVSGASLLLPAAKPEEAAPDLSRLDEEEKAIYHLVKAKAGSIYQSELIRESGLSTVKVTRILDRMEGKHALTRRSEERRV